MDSRSSQRSEPGTLFDVTEALSAAEVVQRCPTAVFSHEESVRRHGLELVGDSGRRRVTVPRNASHVVLDGWQVLRRDLRDDEWDLYEDGSRATTVARCVAELAGELPLDEAVALADSALRQKLIAVSVLVAVLTAKRGPHPAARRAVAALLDKRSGSVLESLFRVLVVLAGLPAPVAQHLIEGVGRVDFAWLQQRVVVELDGFAFHSDRASYRNDRARMNELERQGWRVLRFTWEDVRGRPEHVIEVLREVLALAA